MHELLCTCLLLENALKSNLKGCIFQNFLGGMPPDLPINGMLCMLVVIRITKLYLHVASYNLKCGRYVNQLTYWPDHFKFASSNPVSR